MGNTGSGSSCDVNGGGNVCYDWFENGYRSQKTKCSVSGHTYSWPSYNGQNMSKGVCQVIADNNSDKFYYYNATNNLCHEYNTGSVDC